MSVMVVPEDGEVTPAEARRVASSTASVQVTIAASLGMVRRSPCTVLRTCSTRFLHQWWAVISNDSVPLH